MPEAPLSQISLRPATPEDCQHLWEWRNEHETRQTSFNTAFIPYRDHKLWFSHNIGAPDTLIYIILDVHRYGVGYLRFNIEGEQAEISISVAQSERGKGYGSAAIRLGSDQLLGSGGLKRIVAYLKGENSASMAAFLKAGYVHMGTLKIAGAEAHQMIYEGMSKVGNRESEAFELI